ncbi:aldehyde dehydrogenase [Neolentinus lepideus HHB14362 ss-1]|uniref:Aldehyde dehydrogenase n=1 Tax=Neolentinus lepideus HHB14362 ss-1 TaxID=1314782 RepID=A0A165RQK3_9AGAM|nr:aldehyde dehydrogenase [Neolentinus lepideus HHB14362 ss-1]
MVLKLTPLSEIPRIHARLTKSFADGLTLPLSYRRTQLLQLAHLIQDNADAINNALFADMGRPKLEVAIPETGPIVAGCVAAAENLENWASPEKPEVEAWRSAWDTTVYKVPKGAITIIGPWNFPYTITLLPLIGAIASGCTCAVKPSEYTQAASQLLADLWPRYMDVNAYAIVNGTELETTRLLELKWNHIFFTGSTRVGKIIATAAAKYPVSTTLELGSKSPVVVDADNTDLAIAAKRILWGKQVNAGQICVAPDYVLVPRHQQDQLISAFRTAYKSLFPGENGGIDPQSQLGRILTPAHHARLTRMLESTRGSIVVGGKSEGTKRLDVTVVKDVPLDDVLMEEEIFGPILPVVPFDNMNQVYDIIRERPVPMVIYVFTENDEVKNQFIQHTQSGQLVLNDTFGQLGVHEIPFGGLNDSGYGSYLGKYSFETFTHRRGYINVPIAAEPFMQLRYPPYSEQAYQVMSAAAFIKIPDA